MQISCASRTDVGKVRTNNEDSFLVDQSLGLFVVADGMGGHNAGEVASAAACEIVQREIMQAAAARERYAKSGKSSDIKAIRKVVVHAILNACKEIYRKAEKNPDQAGMGTTLTLVLLVGHDKGILGHVGDSRLYVHRGNVVHQLSEDHTFVNELLKRGAISKAQAKHHPQGNVLSRALGVQPSVSIDTMIFDLDPGDTFLLCSDGLHHYFPDSPELGNEMQNEDLAVGLESMINTVLQRGGHDNVTGILLRVEDDGQVDRVAVDQRIAILKRIPIFTHLSYNELVKVVGLTQLHRLPTDNAFIKEGERGDELYVILAGEIQIEKGGKPIATLQAGAHLGEMAMVDNAPRSATAKTLSPVNLLAMRREEFFGLIRSEPVIATKLLWSFVQVLSNRLRDTNEALQRAGSDVDDPSSDSFEIFIDDDD